MKFRISATAGVCFSVEANSEAEALARADKVIAEFVEGISADVGDDKLDLRVYFNEEAKPEVQNVEDE